MTNGAVQQKIETFRTIRRPLLEAEVAAKRQVWFDRRFAGRSPVRPATPRQAFELFCFDYLGLQPADVSVVTESACEIVWLSRNPCPTLDACQAGGFDTRAVCRGIYEKSTQALISRLDPRLRFFRDYDEIRPHAPHCREGIIRLDFDDLMGQALEEARASRAGGNKGYGAVVALGRQVIARCHDTAITSGDPSRHAEMDALRAACADRGTSDLCGTILVATCEPCPMCAAMAAWCNVSAIVYGVSIAETMALGRSRIALSCVDVVSRAPGWFEVVGGIRRDECMALYR